MSSDPEMGHSRGELEQLFPSQQCNLRLRYRHINEKPRPIRARVCQQSFHASGGYALCLYYEAPNKTLQMFELQASRILIPSLMFTHQERVLGHAKVMPNSKFILLIYTVNTLAKSDLANTSLAYGSQTRNVTVEDTSMALYTYTRKPIQKSRMHPLIRTVHQHGSDGPYLSLYIPASKEGSRVKKKAFFVVGTIPTEAERWNWNRVVSFRGGDDVTVKQCRKSNS
ncbi:hypothetical protein WN55_01328 [Dufourea novaeangliae]|uniref:Uncharacterized protein n=1 Tax=Dufourea novaeangliae TaxID=178035 RepID=A0A154PD23_DUFNO|nr:hypothetical protein WN55_01328 [Dufourea novaeangliae]